MQPAVLLHHLKRQALELAFAILFFGGYPPGVFQAVFFHQTAYLQSIHDRVGQQLTTTLAQEFEAAQHGERMALTALFEAGFFFVPDKFVEFHFAGIVGRQLFQESFVAFEQAVFAAQFHFPTVDGGAQKVSAQVAGLQVTLHSLVAHAQHGIGEKFGCAVGGAFFAVDQPARYIAVLGFVKPVQRLLVTCRKLDKFLFRQADSSCSLPLR